MSRLVAFWSPGRSGATTLLLNVAALLGARRAGLVAVDLNLTTPSLALYADLLPHDHPRGTCLSHLVPALEGGCLTLDGVSRHLLQADEFLLLPGMIDVVAASRMTEEHVRQILQVLSRRHELLLVDVTPALDSVACFPILEMADLICLVVGPEVASRFHTRRCLMPVQGMGWARKTALVLTRAGSVSMEQVAQDVGLPVAASVPELPIMSGLIEAGRIAVHHQSLLPAMARFRTAVEGLATLVAQGGKANARG